MNLPMRRSRLPRTKSLGCTIKIQTDPLPNIAFAWPKGEDTTSEVETKGSGKGGRDNQLSPSPPPGSKVKVMESERELTTGLLAKGTNFRLIVSGHVGVKEIEMLIKKLQLDKEILADEGEDATSDE